MTHAGYHQWMVLDADNVMPYLLLYFVQKARSIVGGGSMKESKQKKPKIKSSYKEQRRRILAKLSEYEPGTVEYSKVLVQLHSLEESNKTRGERRLSADTAVKSGVSLLSTGALIAFERNNVITTKLLSMIPKIRL